MRRKKGMKKGVSLLLVMAMAFSTWLGTAPHATLWAATKPVLNQSSINLLIGKTNTLKLKKKIAGAKIQWKSNKVKIVSVTGNGKIKGIRKGNAKITANVSVSGKRYKLNCNVKVIQKAKSLQITYNKGKKAENIQLKVGEKTSLGVANNPKTSNDVVTSWKSSSGKVAKVNAKGKVTAVASGTATITATAFGKAKSSVKVTVVGTSASVTPVTTPTPNPTSTLKPSAPPTPTPTPDINTLRGAYHNLFSIGCAVNSVDFSVPTILDHIVEQYNSITLENEMKPEKILGGTVNLVDKSEAEFPVPESYKEDKIPKLNFVNVDVALNAARENGLKMRGHTLVWHAQTPAWFFKVGYSSDGALVTKTVMNARLEYYIQQVLLHVQTNYPGIVYAWDVANEIFTGMGTMRAGGENSNWGQSMWVSVYGDNNSEFARKAFEYAAKYREDGVKLFYNDFGEYDETKRDAIYSFLVSLQKKGHVDGMGMQSHLSCSGPAISKIANAIDKYASVAEGFEVQLTELDVGIDKTDEKTYTTSDQAKYYKDLMSMVVAKRKAGVNITNVTFWGLYDSVSWRKNSSPLLYSYYTLLQGFVKKPAYTSVLEAAW